MTSSGWDDFALRSLVSLLAWGGSGRLGPVTSRLLRYGLANAGLLLETLPDISRQLHSSTSGVRKLVCLNGGMGGGINIYYHIPDRKYSPGTGQPWLSLEFPWLPEEPVGNNSLEQAFLRLRLWAREQGVEMVHLYPDEDSGTLRLWARYWQAGSPSRLFRCPGRYGVGARSVWWTSLLLDKTPDSGTAQVINPLHLDVIAAIVPLLAGDPVSPISLLGRRAISANDTLSAIDAGPLGGIVIDTHPHKGFELPDLYLETQTPLDDVFVHTLRSLDSYRRSMPARGLYRLATGWLRAATYKALFEWSVNRLVTAQKAVPTKGVAPSPEGRRLLRQRLRQEWAEELASGETERASLAGQGSTTVVGPLGERTSNPQLPPVQGRQSRSSSSSSSLACSSSSSKYPLLLGRDGASEIDSESEPSGSDDVGHSNRHIGVQPKSATWEITHRGEGVSSVTLVSEREGDGGGTPSAEDHGPRGSHATMGQRHSSERIRRVIVVGQPQANGEDFINHLVGKMPRIRPGSSHSSTQDTVGRRYHPVTIEGFEEPIEFVEIAVGQSPEQGKGVVGINDKRLGAVLQSADNIVWCGDIRTYRPVRNFSTWNKDQAYDMLERYQQQDFQEEEKLFTYTQTFSNKVGKPLLVALTNAHEKFAYEVIGISKVIGSYSPRYQQAGAEEETGDRSSLLQLASLYQRASRFYMQHGITREKIVLMSNSREQEDVLHFRQLRLEPDLRLQLRANTAKVQQSQTQQRPVLTHGAINRLIEEQQLPTTWWQAVVNYLKKSCSVGSTTS